MSKTNTQVVTRSRTGSLVPTRTTDSISSPSTPALAGTKQESNTTGATGPTKMATAEEIKQQMEQNLKLQRAAHNQRRSLDPSTKPNILKVTPTSQGNFQNIKFLQNLYFFFFFFFKITSIALTISESKEH
jgi:tetrahydromethanopterin S-methyltransferase subunit B